MHTNGLETPQNTYLVAAVSPNHSHLLAQCSSYDRNSAISLRFLKQKFHSLTEIYPVQNWSLESGNALGLGAFLQTPPPVLDIISGPMGAIQYWAGVWESHRESAILPGTGTG